MEKCGLRGSTNYVGTAHVKSAGDMLELQSIRDAVKVVNKELKFAERYSRYGDRTPRFRVKCQGRGPRASVARAEGLNPRTYDQSLPLSKAERLDVYIYRV
tara:strand:+ start:43 stop:345 length:303 start_codon:yes stop_codon:yes gene_type:complete